MRKRDINRQLFNTAHYEIIAKQFRTKLEPLFTDVEGDAGARAALVDLALGLTKRFALDNELFKPELFLDRCSPDTDRYPLSELWEGVNQAEEVED